MWAINMEPLNNMNKLKLSCITSALLPLLLQPAFADNTPIETIEVTGDFHKERILTLSASASVFDQNTINARGASYLDEILNNAANINFTAGASRGRFVQIRGVGLRSQFVDPVNPSVGLLIDGINYSGLGGSALLFDVDQVAIYRGPQGTRFGADAMAGMIDMKSNNPTAEQAINLKLGASNYSGKEAGVAIGTGVTDDTSARVSFFKKRSDGYVKTLYAGEPSNKQSEQVARLKVHTVWSNTLKTALTAHNIDIDNGYDGFTLDNSRNSVADEPGKDNQKSNAVAFNIQYSGSELFDVDITTTHLNADTLYSFDEDWVCNDPKQPILCAPGLHPYSYKSKDNYARDHQRGTFEFQLSGKNNDWVTGLFAQRRDVDLVRQYNDSSFNSHNSVSQIALYGQKVTSVSEKVSLITGIRAERYSTDYSDNNQIINKADDTMWGAKLALEYQVVPNTMIYTSVSRGYKIGGVNGEALAKADDKGLNIPTENYTFAPEYLWNAEFGVKGQSEDKRHTLSLSAFYMHRDDMQLKAWQVQEQQFAGYIANASQGHNYGLELEGRFQYTDSLSFTYSAGYLDTQIKDFITQSGIDQNGREQAQAPRYQYALRVNYFFSDNIEGQIGFEGKDDYYFSDSHNAKADNQNLLNASLHYYGDNWTITAWGRNLTDHDVPVRGFRFGNNALKDYVTETFVQYGEPRVVGLTFNYQL
jgi:outer membrane receptor protein involved in Fe transport